MNHDDHRTSPLRIVIAWAIVAIPLGWGVYRSVVKSLPLFEGSAAATAGDTGRKPAAP